MTWETTEDLFRFQGLWDRETLKGGVPGDVAPHSTCKMSRLHFSFLRMFIVISFPFLFKPDVTAGIAGGIGDESPCSSYKVNSPIFFCQQNK